LAVLLDPLGHGDPQVGHGDAVVGEADLGVLDEVVDDGVWLSAPTWTPSIVRLVVCIAAVSARS
jgi:hypothetical protein